MGLEYTHPMTRRRRVATGLAALLAVLLAVTLVLFIANNVQTEINLSPTEASAEATLGELSCRKTLSRSFPFFELTCTEVEAQKKLEP